MRFGELAALKASDIRDRGGRMYIRVARSVTEVNGKLSERPYMKTKKVREVP
jgi:integrase